MLILARKAGESVFVTNGSETIELIIVELKGGQVRLGFKASDNIKIYRHEIYEQIKEENRAAAEHLAKDVDLFSPYDNEKTKDFNFKLKTVRVSQIKSNSFKPREK
jgi:carbon storage regulator